MVKQVVSRELHLAQDGVQQSGPNRFSCMDRQHRGSAIGMAEEVVTAFDPEAFKPQLLQHSEQLFAGESW
jgi:hypothetical protein